MIRRPVLQIIIVSIAVIILSLLYFFYPASNTSAHPKCPFHQITGFYCPGCGSQRSFSALLHGEFLNALNLNILFVLSIPLIFYSAGIFLWNGFSDKKLSQPIFYNPLFTKILILLVVGFWILRNLPIAPFNWLAP
jgi:hypothetical protein